jgi:type I restriction enzyme R subunit
MCADLFQFLLDTGGPEQKTIIFCAGDSHADDVAIELNNLYAKHCHGYELERAEPYAFKCTGQSNGNDYLPDLRGSGTTHFVATTVDLLTTGVDVPCIRNIVFFRYVQSPISFYQMLGRGMRVDVNTNKLMFTVYDYTDATRLMGEDFITHPAPERIETGETPPDPPPPIRLDGLDVQITDEGRFVVMQADGKAVMVAVEEYEAELSARLVAQAPTLHMFRATWIAPDDRRELVDALVNAGYSPSVLRVLKDMNDYDLFDVLGQLGYGLLPRTREDRSLAFRFKHEEWLHALPLATQNAVGAVASQFTQGGTEGLENPRIFETPDVRRAGGLEALKQAGEPHVVLSETKARMFAA